MALVPVWTSVPGPPRRAPERIIWIICSFSLSPNDGGQYGCWSLLMAPFTTRSAAGSMAGFAPVNVRLLRVLYNWLGVR